MYGQTSGGDLRLYIFENRLAVCDCSDFHVCFVLEPFGVSDGPLNLHVDDGTQVGELVNKFDMIVADV